jgi:hypothetical protein
LVAGPAWFRKDQPPKTKIINQTGVHSARNMLVRASENDMKGI